MAKVRVFNKPYTSDSGKTHPGKVWVLNREKLIALFWTGCDKKFHLGFTNLDHIELLESYARETKEVEIPDNLFNRLIANVEDRTTLLQEVEQLNLPVQ